MPEMDYTHLTQDERYQIYILKKAGHNQNVIASLMNRDKSAISRELARNKGRRGYRPKQAQEFAVARKQATVNGRRIAPETWAFAQAKLALQWSPEQIAGYLKTHGEPTSTSPMPMLLGSAAPTKTPTASFGSTSPRSNVSIPSTNRRSISSCTDSTTNLENASVSEPLTRCS